MREFCSIFIFFIFFLQCIRTKRFKKPFHFFIFQPNIDFFYSGSLRPNSGNYMLSKMGEKQSRYGNVIRKKNEKRNYRITTAEMENIKCFHNHNRYRLYMQINDSFSHFDLFNEGGETIVRIFVVAREIAKKEKESIVSLVHLFTAIEKMNCKLIEEAFKRDNSLLQELVVYFERVEQNVNKGGIETSSTDSIPTHDKSGDKCERREDDEKDKNIKCNKKEKETDRTRSKVDQNFVEENGIAQAHRSNLKYKDMSFSKYCKLALSKALSISAGENRKRVRYVDMLQAILECCTDLNKCERPTPVKYAHQLLDEYKKKRINSKERKIERRGNTEVGNTINNASGRNNVNNIKTTKNTGTYAKPSESDDADSKYDIKSETSDITTTSDSSEDDYGEDDENKQESDRRDDNAKRENLKDEKYGGFSNLKNKNCSPYESQKYYKQNSNYNIFKPDDYGFSASRSMQNKPYGNGAMHSSNNNTNDTFNTYNIDSLIKNMNDIAKGKRNINFYGRKKELRNLITALGKKKKSNALLIGKSGVGKTAIVEHLVYLIVNNKVPSYLKDFTIYNLNMNDIVAGTQYRGMFEEKLKQVLQTISKTKKNILFIDEIHTIRGAGKGENALDAANIMKPFLSSDDFQCIGATTWDEYTKYFEKDSALSRRFTPIIVNELSSEDTYLLLKKIYKTYERYHNVFYTESALKSIVTLSEDYLPNMQNPDKAIEVLDDAGVYQKLKYEKYMQKLGKKKKELLEKNDKYNANSKLQNTEGYPQILMENNTQNYKLHDSREHQNMTNRMNILNVDSIPANCRYTDQSNSKAYEKYETCDTKISPQKMNSVNDRRKISDKKGANEMTEDVLQGVYDGVNMKYVTSDVIEAVVGELSSVKILRRNKQRDEKILELKNKLNRNIIGQEKAMDIISKYFLKAVTNISDPERPIGTALLCGSTGVGKTLCAKVLSNYLFKKNNLIVINMSEFSESHSVSKLYGSPPGYIGCDQGGFLTESVKKNPFSIILFDEIEKAHPKVLLVLLRILDEGSLTDAQGRPISFRNTFVIMTSNVGADIISEYFKICNNDFRNLGFCYYKKGKQVDGEASKRLEQEKKKLEEKIYNNQWYEELLPEVEEELKKRFPLEFLNRIDEKILFRQFLKADIVKILTNVLCLLKKRLKRRKRLNLVIHKSVSKYLQNEITNLYDMTYGARYIKRAVNNYVESPISTFLINNYYESNDSVVLKLSPDKKIFVELHKETVATK